MSFDTKKYINHLAEELIRNFDFASIATTPVLKGSAREKEVIKKLQMLLPNNVGIGSGCVIDSYGNTSRQMDVVIYENDFCPVFCVNDSPETTYYPCEGVIAVGEIKTSLNTKELDNIFEKAKSVKRLIRHSVEEVGLLVPEKYSSYRKYNSNTSFECAPSESFDQTNKLLDQIFCFSFCGKLELLPQTLVEKISEHINTCEIGQENNLISILNEGLLLYRNKTGNKIVYSKVDAESIVFVPNMQDNFEFVLGILHQIILNGRTVPITAYNRYLNHKTSINLSNCFEKII